MQAPEVVDSIGRGWRFKFGIANRRLASWMRSTSDLPSMQRTVPS